MRIRLVLSCARALHKAKYLYILNNLYNAEAFFETERPATLELQAICAETDNRY